MWARSTQDSITIVIRGASVIGFSVCPFRIFYLDFQMSISQLFKELQRLKFRNLNLSSPNILLEPILELWWPSWIFVIQEWAPKAGPCHLLDYIFLFYYSSEQFIQLSSQLVPPLPQQTRWLVVRGSSVFISSVYVYDCWPGFCSFRVVFCCSTHQLVIVKFIIYQNLIVLFLSVCVSLKK